MKQREMRALKEHRRVMSKLKVAIVGVGNCCRSLLEGLGHYEALPEASFGLMHPSIGGYRVSDIEIVAAFDVDKRKVGRGLREAAYAAPNRTLSIGPVSDWDLVVLRGPTEDGVSPEMRGRFVQESEAEESDLVEALRASGTQVVLNYLPTGAERASRRYALAALSAGCSFINCTPARLGGDPEFVAEFARHGLVLLGDDIKSQLGATILNRALLELLITRGVRILSSDQTNYGGNADHFNLQFRGGPKNRSKEAALTSVVGCDGIPATTRMVYREELYDHKHAVIELKGEIFGGAPMSIRIELEDEDSPNSAGVVVDAVRGVAVLVEQRRAHLGAQLGAALMKAPLEQLPEVNARQRFDELIGAEPVDRIC